MLATSVKGQVCTACGVEFPDGLLACPSCQKLVHSEKLRALSETARAAAQAGDLSTELGTWRSVLELLPPESRQYEQLREKTLQLSAAIDRASLGGATTAKQDAPGTQGTNAGGKAGGKAGGLSALGVLLWKFKAIGLFMLGKGKLLLLGLTKAPTLLSMLFTMGVYFTLWGWQFAVGLVLCIYVHEMGHVVALQRFGVRASAPMFVPGFGAFVRMQQYPTTPSEDARVGLAGPIWGLGAALVCLVLYKATGVGIFGALAKLGAMINAFNLLPVWQLDGARGFHALDKQQRMLAACALGVAGFLTGEALLLVIGAVAAYRAFATPPAESPDQRAFLEYVFLVAALATIMHLHVPA